MTTSRFPGLQFAGLLLLGASSQAASPPLALNPENPHYFQFRGKPLVVITSGEHYGAVLNLDFDFNRYLQSLKREGMNGTRTWSGAYCEPSSAFNIASNTLAPLPGRFLCPWPRSAEPGYSNGGNKFDLERWDPAYFKRLQRFVARASQLGIIVELNLFCPFYEESMWELSPMNARNNVNHVGAIARTNVYTLDRSGPLLRVQENLTRKLVTELQDFDNLYYEICNEPYFGGVTLEWQRHITDIITETELPFRKRHLISQNIANENALVLNPHPQVSIFNFHYATPPDTVGMNFSLTSVIGDNETGFRGTNDAPYRMEAWDFLVAGGGLFNNLDYSFVAGHEQGDFVYPVSQPGGGTATLRRQLRFLGQTLRALDFVHMRPANDLVQASLPLEVSCRVLAQPGETYLLYLRTPWNPKTGTTAGPKLEPGHASLALTLPSGNFSAEWLDPENCTVRTAPSFVHWNGTKVFALPRFETDIALLVRRLYSRTEMDARAALSQP